MNIPPLRNIFGRGPCLGRTGPLTLGFTTVLLGVPLCFAAISAWTGDARSGRDRLESEREELDLLDAGSTVEQRRHERVRNARSVAPEAAEAIYRELADKLADGYAQAGVPAARDYMTWRRANTAPYPSYSHGRRYLNNYVNERAGAYLDYEGAGRLPVGSIVAKDSFSVDADGNVALGSLFLMEKMPAGFNYVSGDWRYSMISPEGELVGRTKGGNAAAVRFCISCHLAAEKTDHLFFLPEQYR